MNAENEMLFYATMAIAKKLLNEGIINEEEYSEINTIFTKKYNPILSKICSKNDLNNSETHGNM